jgi:hypothetical protein
MRTLIASLFALCLIPLAPAAPDAELTALLADNATTSEKIVTYADQKAAALVAAQAELAQVRQQLATEQAARVKAEADRAAALRAVADAKAQIQEVVAKL